MPCCRTSVKFGSHATVRMNTTSTNLFGNPVVFLGKLIADFEVARFGKVSPISAGRSPSRACCSCLPVVPETGDMANSGWRRTSTRSRQAWCRVAERSPGLRRCARAGRRCVERGRGCHIHFWLQGSGVANSKRESCPQPVCKI